MKLNGPDLIQRVLDAKNAHNLFRPWGDTEADVEAAYKRFLWVHPDHAEPEDVDRATEAFARLGELRSEALAQIKGGRYGKDSSWIVTTRKKVRYDLSSTPAWQGGSCDIFIGERGVEPVYVKVARVPGDADLLQNEAKMLSRVLKHDGPGNYTELVMPYLPDYIESFQVPIKGARHRANAFRIYPEMFTLTEIRQAYPDGVHPKHAAWMFRRMLTALGCLHEAGVVHGAILPQHLLFHPEYHGLQLLDWRATTEIGHTIKLLSNPVVGPIGTTDMVMCRDWYPESVFNKEPARPEVDISMASLCMTYVCGEMPKQLRAFLKGCRANRLPHAWELKDEFDTLIEGMWGPRKYVPFVMPKAA